MDNVGRISARLRRKLGNYLLHELLLNLNELLKKVPVLTGISNSASSREH